MPRYGVHPDDFHKECPLQFLPSGLPLFRVFILVALCAFATIGNAQTPASPTPPANERLAELLENDDTRRALIEQLRQTAQTVDAQPTAPVAPTLPQRIALATQSVAERAIAEASTAWSAIGLAQDRLADDNAAFHSAALPFVGLVTSTLLVFWLLGRVARNAYARLDQRVQTADPDFAPLHRTAAVVAAIAVHLATVFGAWLAGHGVALFALGDGGELRLIDSLFLNAFLVVEGVRVVLATLLSNRYAGLRLVPASGEEAAYWSAWGSRLVYFLGYGLLLAVPAASGLLAPEAGRLLAIVVMVLAWLQATVIVMQNRARVRSSIDELAERMQTGFARVSLAMMGRIWHLAATGYLAALIVTAVFFRDDALGFMLGATGQSLIAVLGGVLLSTLLRTVVMRRIELPEETRARFPLLETRLNAYVPGALKLARFAILVIVLAIIVDAWTAFDLGAWATSDAGTATIGRIVTVLLIIALALLAWLLAASWIEYRLNPDATGAEATPRVKTLLAIFRNAIAIALIVLTTMIVLAEIGVNIAPLIAGAGVLGLAIGFGAQKLVQDVITGLFIQLEGAINVGDVVTAGGLTGTVEKLTIRSLGLRDISGTYHLLPFSSVDMVSNFVRDFGYHVGEYGVAYREDTDEVITHLKAAFEELRTDPEVGPNIVGELEVHGVTALADSAVNVRVRIKTLPGTQFGTGRAYNRLVKRHFDAAGIEIPFPHMTLYFGEDKLGKAPPANLRLIPPGEA